MFEHKVFLSQNFQGRIHLKIAYMHVEKNCISRILMKGYLKYVSASSIGQIFLKVGTPTVHTVFPLLETAATICFHESLSQNLLSKNCLLIKAASIKVRYTGILSVNL